MRRQVSIPNASIIGRLSGVVHERSPLNNTIIIQDKSLAVHHKSIPSHCWAWLLHALLPTRTSPVPWNINKYSQTRNTFTYPGREWNPGLLALTAHTLITRPQPVIDSNKCREPCSNTVYSYLICYVHYVVLTYRHVFCDDTISYFISQLPHMEFDIVSIKRFKYFFVNIQAEGARA